MIHYLVVFGIYFAIIFGIGIYAARSTRNNADYILGGRSLSPAITALGAGASDMSGWLLLGLPGAVFISGLDQLWLPLGLTIGAYLNWKFVAKKLRIYTENVGDALTIPSYFDARFGHGNSFLRLMTAVVILVFFTLYASAGFVSGAYLFQELFHLSYQQALWIGAIFLVLYTTVGGFLAVNWVDFFQGSLMFFALLITPLVAWLHLSDMTHEVSALPTHFFNLVSDKTSMVAIISLLAWGLGYFGQPHILVRFMAIRDVRSMGIARRICMSWMVISLIGAFAVGIIGAIFFAGKPHAFDNETIFLVMAKAMFPGWMAAILFAAVLSAVMSTIAAQLLASSSALTEDIAHYFHINLGERAKVYLGRAAVVVVSLLAVLFANNPNSTILSIVGHAWAGMGAAFGPVILFSLFWRRCTAKGATAAMITGSVVVLFWIIGQKQHWSSVFELYEIIPGFVLASLALVWVSLKDAQPCEQTLAYFDEVARHSHERHYAAMPSSTPELDRD